MSKVRDIWDKFVSLLLRIPIDKFLHFLFGALIAAFFAITLRFNGCIFWVFIAAALKEFFDAYTTDVWDWKDALATVIGGLVIQLFVILGCIIN